MKTFIYFFLSFISISVTGQVGINTQTPETTFEVVGKPNDITHFDGILPPRITGDQLATKSYSEAKKGAVVFVTDPSSNLQGQVKQVSEPGLYYFDGSVWQPSGKEKDPVEYKAILSLDSTSASPLTETTAWSPPQNEYGNTNAYLTSSKYYTVGTKNFADLEGYIQFRKVHGIVNVSFQLYRSSNSPVTENAFINIQDLLSDIGYIPEQIVLLHRENSTQVFPALLENYAIQIPQISLSSMSTDYYAYGEVQGYSNWKKPLSIK